MLLTRRGFLGAGLGALAGATGLLRAAQPALTPDQVHLALVRGNRRFVSGRSRHPHSSLAWAKRMAREGQHPKAVVLCCSDSRVAPEIVFDQGIGDLFVVRVAGNVANEDELASIEYAVEHLGTPFCLVLGHSGCGAVGAVVKGEHLPEEIEHLVAPIQRSLDKAKALDPNSTELDLMSATVRLNVLESCSAIANGPKLLRDAITSGRLRVEGAVYDLETGRVAWVTGVPASTAEAQAPR